MLSSTLPTIAITRALTAPPASPVLGKSYIVPTGSTGAWSGSANKLAYWNGSIWKFSSLLKPGFSIWLEDEKVEVTWTGTVWQTPANVPDAAAGSPNGVATLGSDGKVPVGQLPSFANAYDLAGYWQGKPSNGATLFYVPILRAMTFAINFAGSSARSRVATTASTTYIIKKNGTQIGTLTFAAGTTTGTFTMASANSFAVGDILQVEAPATADGTQADIGFTFFGTLN